MIGLLCYGFTIVVGLLDTSVLGFWGQLILLGVAWNFLFVSGTTLLPSSHRPGELFRAQEFNDVVVFSCQAIASLAVDWAVNLISWLLLLLLCLASISLLCGMLLLTSQRPQHLA